MNRKRELNIKNLITLLCPQTFASCDDSRGGSGHKIFLMGDRIGNHESCGDLFSGRQENIAIQKF